jgi:hypothetical protein
MEAPADDKGLDGRIPAALGFRDCHLFEKTPKLRVQKRDISAAKNLGNKVSSRSKDVGGYIQRREQ